MMTSRSVGGMRARTAFKRREDEWVGTGPYWMRRELQRHFRHRERDPAGNLPIGGTWVSTERRTHMVCRIMPEGDAGR